MRVKNILFSVFLGILLISLIVAENNSTNNPVNAANNTFELQRFYDNIKCRTDFYSGVVSSMNSINSSSDVTSALAKLNSDLAQIKIYADSGDRTLLKQYIVNNYESDSTLMKTTIAAWRKANIKGLPLEQKRTLLSEFNKLRADYDTCHLNTFKNYANGRINYFNNVLEVYQKKTDALSEKGIDVSSLNKIISDAKAQVVDPLQNIIYSATDPSSLNQAVKQYCLFDGCAGGINFHLSAKFEVAKLQIALNKIGMNSNYSQEKITQLQTDINTANSVLTEVGTAQYTEDQKTRLWNFIKDGYNVIRTLAENKPLNITTG